MVPRLLIKLIALFFISLPSFAANRYWAASGSNSNTGTISNPFQTLAKFSSLSLVPGDTCFFNGGEYFFGTLPTNQSGSNSNPIVFASYGTGQAHITGMVNLTSWLFTGGNVWTSSLDAGGSENMVVMYGNQVAPGRTPNTGWQTISSYTNAGSLVTLTGNLPSSINFLGGYAVSKVREWIVTNGRITNHSSSNLTFYNSVYDPINRPTGFLPEQQSGFGYFIQHHPSTLDQQNEWYYDSTNNILRVYSPGGSPASFNVRAATLTNVLNISSSYLTFINLSFEGSKGNLINFASGKTNIRFANCGFYYAGRNAIDVIYNTNFTIENCIFKWINNNAITAQISSNIKILNNTIKQNGMMVGSGIGDNEAGNGMLVNGNGIEIKYNRLDSIGYNGISWSGSNVDVSFNYITNHTYTATDGGGIYSGYNISDQNRLVSYNIIMYGRGERQGTPYGPNKRSMALYSDEFNHFTKYIRNFAAYNNGAGMYGHKAASNYLDSNMFIYNLESGIKWAQDFDSVADFGAQRVRNNIVKRNVIYSGPDQLIYDFYSTPDVLNLFFDTLNNNIIARPSGLTNSIHKQVDFSTDYYYTPSTFKGAYSAYDQASTGAPAEFSSGTPLLVFNPTKSPLTISLDGQYKSVRSESFTTGSIVLPPFTGNLLMRTGNLIVNPTIQFKGRIILQNN